MPVASQQSAGGTNQPWVKKYNESMVLDLVRRRGPVSRALIASTLGLEFQTVSNICTRLTASGLLVQNGVVQDSKRQSRALSLNAEAVYSLGVEINRAQGNMVLISFDGTVKSRRTFPVEGREPAEVLQQIAAESRSLLEETGVPQEKSAGMGVSAPGPIDRRRGTILSPLNFPGWENFPLQDQLQDLLGTPVWMENTATSAALGEQWAGAGTDTENFLYVYLGPGIGVGVVANGRVIHGAYGNAGEFAHLTMDPSGPRCGCGRRGCLVQYATPRALLHLMQRAALENANLHRKADVDLPRNASDALAPDAPAWMKAAAETGFKMLGRAVSNLTVLFDPEKVIFGGPSIELFGNEFLTATQLAAKDLPDLGRPASALQLSSTGSDAGPLGAASLPLHALYMPSV